MATSTGDARLKIMRALLGQRHRYTALRTLSQAVSLGVLVSVPLSGLARVDLWRGDHRLLFDAAPFKHALGGVILGIGAMYVVTFLSNVVAARLFCGWGCPVGQVSRFGDEAAIPGLSWRQRLFAHLRGAAFSAAFVVAVLAWWTDLRVLVLGTPRELAVAWGLVAFGVAGAFAHGRWWRWSFCKSACPIGVYYSFVSPARWFGVHFRNADSTCIQCNACDRICPVQLTPRDLASPIPARAGVSIADAPGKNHCLECGDCIRACERMVSLKGIAEAPLHLGYFTGPQRVDVEAEAEAVGSRQ